MKHLAIAFLSLISASANAGGESCQHVLMVAPQEQQIEQTIHSLAKLKMNLDLSLSEKNRTSQSKTLEEKYKASKAELIKRQLISKSDLDKKLREQIALLQKENSKEDEIRQEKVNHEHDVASRPRYWLKHSPRIQFISDSGIRRNPHFLSKDHTKFMTQDGGQLTVRSTDTGEVLSKKFFNRGLTYISKADSFILRNVNKFVLFDANTLSEHELQFNARDISIDIAQISLSPDQNTVLLYDQKHFYFHDIASDKTTQHGEFISLPRGKTFKADLLPDNSVIIYIDQQVLRYWPTTKRHVTIIPDGSRINSILTADNSEIVFQNDSQIVFHNIKTAQTRSLDLASEVETITHSLNPQELWVVSAGQIHLLNISSLNIEKSLEWDPSILMSTGSTSLISTHSENTQGLKFPNAVFTKDDLSYPIFTFEDYYAKDSDLTILNQVISTDGNAIVNFSVSKSTKHFFLETWERDDTRSNP